jgi:hypothetical protein
MNKFVLIAIAGAIFITPLGCSKNSNPAATTSNTKTFIDAGVSADLIGTWNFYLPTLDSVLIGTSMEFSTNNIILNGSSILSTDAKPVANNGNIGFALSSSTGYVYDYSLSPDKDSLYLAAEGTATPHPVTRDAATAGIFVKQ